MKFVSCIMGLLPQLVCEKSLATAVDCSRKWFVRISVIDAIFAAAGPLQSSMKSHYLKPSPLAEKVARREICCS